MSSNGAPDYRHRRGNNLAEKTEKPANGWANWKAAPLLYLSGDREREREKKEENKPKHELYLEEMVQ